jgi:N-glycosylase/DNA lyase
VDNPKASAAQDFDQVALRVLTEMRNAIGQPMVYGEYWHVEFARRLRDAWLKDIQNRAFQEFLENDGRTP